MATMPPRLDRRVWMEIAARRRAPAPTPPAESDRPPADCVERFPTLSDEFVELVRFSSAGKVQLMISIPATEDMTPFVRWMNSWGRRRDRKTLRIV